MATIPNYTNRPLTQRTPHVSDSPVSPESPSSKEGRQVGRQEDPAATFCSSSMPNALARLADVYCGAHSTYHLTGVDPRSLEAALSILKVG